MENDTITKMLACIVASHWGTEQQTNENRVELRETAFTKDMEHHNELESDMMLGCWEVWHGVTIISKEVGQHAMDMKCVAFFNDQMGIRRGHFCRMICRISVIGDACFSLCKHSWSNLRVWNSVNCFNTIQFDSPEKEVFFVFTIAPCFDS
jgi:hypothetical protein